MVWVYRFSAGDCQGDAEMASLLGGKGANLAEMCKLGLPVPPGFTITTEACREFYSPAQAESFGVDLVHEVRDQLAWLKGQFGYMPLVSVRSGAPVSMPGMMDTILNVGLSIGNIEAWSERIGSRAAWDSYRRLIQMLGVTAFNIDPGVFAFQLASILKAHQVKSEAGLEANGMTALAMRFGKAFREATGEAFPQDLETQLFRAIQAVFVSWKSKRAVEYRKLNGIPEDIGTAVNVQAMVFGNTGPMSGTGVLFTRDPATGEDQLYGEFLADAQGEDVVAGTHTLTPLGEFFGPDSPSWLHQLSELAKQLENHYRDMMDIEFTVQDGKLWILQCRVGKRSALAAFKIAVDLVHHGLIEPKTALSRITPAQYKLVRRPRIDPGFTTPPAATGLPASPGVATGRPVFSSADAVNCAQPCILVVRETTPEDIAGMAKAQGILTAIGGATSHAAVVARAMDKPCVVGCTGLEIGEQWAMLDGIKKILPESVVTIDGASGRVWVDVEVPVIDTTNDPAVLEVAHWALELSGCAIQTGKPFSKSKTYPVRIMAADWWGDLKAMQLVLDQLAKLDDRKGITLDLRPPEGFRDPADDLLEHCCTTMLDVHFEVLLLGKLKVMAPKLKGLTLAMPASPAQVAEWLEYGYKVVVGARTVADLLNSDAVTVDPGFIEQVIGGDQAWQELQQVLLAAGRSIEIVPKALPPAYAVFTMLGK